MSKWAYRVALTVLVAAAMAASVNWSQIMSNGQGGAPPRRP